MQAEPTDPEDCFSDTEEDTHELNLRLVQLELGDKAEAVSHLLGLLGKLAAAQGLMLHDVYGEVAWQITPRLYERRRPVQSLPAFQRFVVSTWAKHANLQQPAASLWEDEVERFEKHLRSSKQSGPAGIATALACLAVVAHLAKVPLIESSRGGRSPPHTTLRNWSGWSAPPGAHHMRYTANATKILQAPTHNFTHWHGTYTQDDPPSPTWQQRHHAKPFGLHDQQHSSPTHRDNHGQPGWQSFQHGGFHGGLLHLQEHPHRHHGHEQHHGHPHQAPTVELGDFLPRDLMCM